ncbi:MAG: energy transducer TonB [Pseudomonadota bacterium]
MQRLLCGVARREFHAWPYNKQMQLTSMDSKTVLRPQAARRVDSAVELRRYTSRCSSLVSLFLFTVVLFGCSSSPELPFYDFSQVEIEEIEGDLVPVQLCAPDYPRRAALERIEGYVEMSFVVLESGKPVNIEVIASNPPGVFDKAAVKAMACSQFGERSKPGRKTMTTEFRWN